MANSVFHIVKRADDKFGIAQLSLVKKKANSKLQQVGKNRDSGSVCDKEKMHQHHQQHNKV